MPANSRQLAVWFNQRQVGLLSEHDGWWQFQYSASWLSAEDAFAIAPRLPLQDEPFIDSANLRPVQWWFDNLLPEEQARQLLAQHHRLALDDSFALLQAVGAESAGALTLLALGEVLPAASAVPIGKAELSRRIRQLPRLPLNDGERKRMSLAGAQHKMLLIADGQQYFEPVGDTPSSHILKPEHSQPELYPFTVRNEWFVMCLADACGLWVPPVAVDYVPEAIYLVERFDRQGRYPHQTRLHVLDGCQVLGLPAHAKYRESSLDNLALLLSKTRRKAQNTLRIYRWLVFNFLLGNGDAHLKNLSFEMRADGLDLSPHYDLLSTVIYEAPHQHADAFLSQPLPGATRFSEVRRQHLLEAATLLGLRTAIANREIDRLLQVIRPAADALIAPLQTHGVPGELRMLRQISSLAIDEFSAQLKS